MEGILYDIEMFASSFTVVFGLVLLPAIDAWGILLSSMADEEENGKRIFWAESPFTDVSESEGAVENARYLPAGGLRDGAILTRLFLSPRPVD